MKRLRIASRRSALALAQARLVANRIATVAPDQPVEIVEIDTTGDRDRATPVTELTELGAFVRSVQVAVLDGRADLAVHSCKDLPTSGPPELRQWFPDRASPWDVLCGTSLDELPAGASVGTGSPRRTEQLRSLRPDIEIVPIRGNVPTRLDKVASGGLDAVVLAEAGLLRLGRQADIDYVFSIAEMVPAPAQAAICVEARPGTPAGDLLDAIDVSEVRAAVEAERALLSLTGAGCRAALGAHAEVDGSGTHMTGFVSDERGPRRGVATGADANEAAARLQRELGL